MGTPAQCKAWRDSLPPEVREQKRADAREWKALHREHVHKSRARHYREHKQKSKEQQAAYLLSHPAKKAEWDRNYRKRHEEALSKKRAAEIRAGRFNVWAFKRYHGSIQANIAARIRASLTQSLRRALQQKFTDTFSLVGCSAADLVKHLESQFQPGMSWALRSKIDIDHIRPVTSFILC